MFGLMHSSNIFCFHSHPINVPVLYLYIYIFFIISLISRYPQHKLDLAIHWMYQDALVVIKMIVSILD